MTNLSITQQYFILALGHDKKETFSTSSEKGICFIASQLLELTADSTITFDSKNRIVTTQSLPANKEYLTIVYEFIKKKEPVKLATITDYFVTSFKNNLTPAFQLVGTSLMSDGYVQKRAKKQLLGLSDVYEVTESALTHATNNLNDIITIPHDCTDEQLALITLLEKGKILKKYVSKHTRSQAKQLIDDSKNTMEESLIRKMMDRMDSVMATIISV
ncbi:GPP34 family phosphoprotein [Vagococcus sp. BWB3-3]|uniref:GPP34 family phosphoprotein n=1 Tax=Vagococcus allomyrinae TaxID=2794353 RepID=A0A940SVE6_9ENTE|nr:GPP34 family phosphoprotein [Vagococcus allomyrinae]MBP1042270.1 GPP34 family phosphoprotein [Vagococcus allomyrinae]